MYDFSTFVICPHTMTKVGANIHTKFEEQGKVNVYVCVFVGVCVFGIMPWVNPLSRPFAEYR